MRRSRDGAELIRREIVEALDPYRAPDASYRLNSPIHGLISSPHDLSKRRRLDARRSGLPPFESSTRGSQEACEGDQVSSA